MKNLKLHKLAITFFLSVTLVFGCSNEDCEEIRKENCAVTFELNPVCGCNGVTYPNPSTAECSNINDYTMGECD